MRFRSNQEPTADRTVREEWLAGLPEDKQRAFRGVVAQLEAGYAMFSVAVNEAFSLRRSGSLVRAREQVATAAAVMSRFAEQLDLLLGAIVLQARECRHYPRVSPLNPSFFRWPVVRRRATWEGALDFVLATRSLRFQRKLRALVRSTRHLGSEFRHAAREISEGSTVHPESHWEALDSLHYDLNTCLREAIVVLKSFLLGLSPEQLEAFRRRLEEAALVAPGEGAGFSQIPA
ncbi:MAG TPA: hypothetical protein VGS20_16410 [Candidatus Acidoferrales bacterium]|nr:hypothetical protein [Candidatus Acidoferrales bacterium]